MGWAGAGGPPGAPHSPPAQPWPAPERRPAMRSSRWPAERRQGGEEPGWRGQGESTAGLPPRPRQPLTWAAEGGAGRGRGRAWGPARGGVQWAGCGVWGQLGPQLLRRSLLAGLWAGLSLTWRKQKALSRNAVLTSQGSPVPLVGFPQPVWPGLPIYQCGAVGTATREIRGLQ